MDKEIINSNFATWKWNKDFWVIEVYDPKLTKQISKWAFASKGPSFGVNHYRRQFIVPSRKFRLACKFLGCSIPKNPNRVAAGKQAADSHPINRG